MNSVILSMAIVLLGTPVLQGVPDDAVVGRANGPAGPIRVTAGRLRAYAATTPNKPLDALVTDLIDFELLAAVAQQQGLDRSDAVREATSKVLVRRYLQRDFEPKLTAETLPEAHVAKSFEQNKSFFQHPELRQGVHILVAEQPPSAMPRRPTNPLLDAEAKDLAERIRASMVAAGVSDVEAFTKGHEGFVDEAKSLGLIIEPQTLPRFAKVGKFDRAFTEEAFKLQKETVSEVFPSSFGWHIVWLTEIEPALHRTRAEAEPEIRARILGQVRAKELQALTNQLAQKYNALLNPGPLQQLEARRGVDPRLAKPAPTP